jgi:hypothetical protein
VLDAAWQVRVGLAMGRVAPPPGDARPGAVSQPRTVAVTDRGRRALAGLWRAGVRQQVRELSLAMTATRRIRYAPSCTIGCRWITSRQRWPARLGKESADPARVKSAAQACLSSAVTFWPVSPRVGKVKEQRCEHERADLDIGGPETIRDPTPEPAGRSGTSPAERRLS